MLIRASAFVRIYLSFSASTAKVCSALSALTPADRPSTGLEDESSGSLPPAPARNMGSRRWIFSGRQSKSLASQIWTAFASLIAASVFCYIKRQHVALIRSKGDLGMERSKW